MVLLLFALFRAGFEPLSWDRDHGLSLRIEGRLVFLGGITTSNAAQNRSGWRRKGTEPWARRVFRPTVHGFLRPFAGAPIRRVAPPSAHSRSCNPCGPRA
jgi:hypothetical protein